MHRIFSGDGRLAVLNIRKSARDHRRSQPPVQQRPVLIILSILSIHVQSIDRENRIKASGSLLLTGHAGSMFHSRMIRTLGRGRHLFEETWGQATKDQQERSVKGNDESRMDASEHK